MDMIIVQAEMILLALALIAALRENFHNTRAINQLFGDTIRRTRKRRTDDEKFDLQYPEIAKWK